MIRITVAIDGLPAEGMFVIVRIPTTRKNPFGLGFGPTDTGGRLEIAREALIDSAMNEKRHAMMDYGDPELDASGEVTVQPQNREGLRRALKGFAVWGKVAGFPADYERMLKRAIDLLEGHQAAALSAEVAGEFGEWRVRGMTVQA